MTESSTRTSTVTVLDVRASRTALIAGSLGNLVEWYEFAIYAYMAPIIAPLFFPSENPTTALLSTFLVFALAFALRPIGAIVFGRLADRLGRRPVLVVIIGLMAIATTAIGLLPTHAQIGVIAPLLLTLCRVGQGLSAGGEVGGAVSLMVESAPPAKRGLYGSWSFVGTTLGFVLGGGVATVLASALSDDALNSWGWRIGFLLAAPMGLVVLYLRLRVDETPHFKQLSETQKSTDDPAALPDPSTSRTRPLRYLLVTIGALVVYNAVGNTFMVGMPAFLSKSFEMSLQQAYLLALLTGLAAAASMPAFGALSDRTGRRPVLLAGSIAVALLSYPLYAMLGLGFTSGTIALVVAGILIGAVGGPMPAFLSERFRTRNRATGVSLAYAIPVAVFGGTAPYIITWLAATTGNALSAAYYTLGCAVISTIAILNIESSQRNHHLEELDD